ncbi:MAG: chemotaxis protein CheW [Candidatus Methylomirabilales bacterium]
MASVLLQASGVRACLVVLAGTPFAVDVRAAKEIVVLEGCTAVPQGPPHLLGVANLRGVILPLVDIRPLLGLAARRMNGRTTALVVSPAGQPLAVAVDAVLGLESLGEPLPCSEGTRRTYGPYAQGLLPRGQGVVPLLNMPALVEALRREAPRREPPAAGGGG